MVTVRIPISAILGTVEHLKVTDEPSVLLIKRRETIGCGREFGISLKRTFEPQKQNRQVPTVKFTHVLDDAILVYHTVCEVWLGSGSGSHAVFRALDKPERR